jgi:hypothetical protein
MFSTNGSESASAPALPSSGSGYPTTSTMTVIPGGCGEELRWQPLSNRYETLDVCRAANGALMLQSRYDEEEFYNVVDARLFSCTPSSIWLPAKPTVGRSFGGSCTNAGNKNSGGMTVNYKGEVVGDGTEVVGASRVPVVHVAIQESFKGDTVGTGTWSLWIDPENGLPVKESRTETSRSKSVVGWVPSKESFSLELTSLTPKQ